ncbi:MAG TPA: S8 family serine peptidase [Candidatus Limnocylindrales bacterium]
MSQEEQSDRALEPEELDESADRGLRAALEAAGLDPSALVLSESVAHLQHLGQEARFYKLFDPQSQQSHRIAVGADGQAVDVDELLARERQAHWERYGAMQPALHRLLEHFDGDRLVPVMVCYAVEEQGEPFEKTQLDGHELDDKEMAKLDKAARKTRTATVTRARELHNLTMDRLGLQPRDASKPSGPFVVFSVRADAIPALAREEHVAFVGLAREREKPDYPTIPESLPTTRTEIVHDTGVRGAGVRIAVLESGTPDVNAGCFNIGATQDSSQPANSHMTKSLGIIGNRYDDGRCGGDWQGYAPEATVLLANADDYQDRYEWARDRGANVVTMSWHFPSEEDEGTLHSRDIYFDYWVTRWPYPTVFTSAGNEAEDEAFASGKGYNILGVGNVLNEDDGDRCDDEIASSSSWKNPTTTHGDHEVPAIAAPGSRHALLGSSFGGTSCATPVAASIAALLMSRNRSLRIWPEAIRAILLATANYQRADDADYSRASDGKDGAGMVNALYGLWTAGRRESNSKPQFRAHDYGRAREDDFKDGYFSRTWTARVMTTNSRIRVALAWNALPFFFLNIPLVSWLDADLDLHVFDPGGNLVASGSSWDNSWELVEFRPRRIGEYTIKIRGYSVPSHFSSWFGIAWTAHYDLC